MSPTVPSAEPPARPVYFRRALLPACAVCIQLGVLWGTSLPLGIPEEWTWARNEFPTVELINSWPALISGAILALFVIRESRRAGILPPQSAWLRLGILWLLGTLWIGSTLAAVPGIAGLSRAPFVLFYTRSSGYFTQARENVDDVGAFLRTYREHIDDSSIPENYLHLGTHPPGLTLGLIGLLKLCQQLPPVRDAVLATRPASIRESETVIAGNLTPRQQQTWETDAAVLWLATFISLVGVSGTCVPLYWLCRRTSSPEVAWWTAALWLLVPAAAIFVPKSDVLFPCLAMWSQWCWLKAIDRSSFAWGAVTGGMLFLSVCLSLAFVPVGLMITLQGLLMPNPVAPANTHPRTWGDWLKSRCRVFGGAALAFCLPIAIVWLAGWISLPEVWLKNLENHAAFYQHATRTYTAWLMENPLELAFALGLPVALLGLWGLFLLGRKQQPGRVELLIPVLVWGLLWISGKNQGEAARLWVFLMPYALWVASLAAEKLQRNLPIWFVAQMIVCLGTVLRIDGFHFQALLP